MDNAQREHVHDDLRGLVKGEVYFDVSEGLRLGLVEAPTDVDYDLDHVALRSADAAETADLYEPLGFAPTAPLANFASSDAKMKSHMQTTSSPQASA